MDMPNISYLEAINLRTRAEYDHAYADVAMLALANVDSFLVVVGVVLAEHAPHLLADWLRVCADVEWAREVGRAA